VSAYVIATVEITDPDVYARYLEQSLGLLDGVPTEVLVSDDAPETVEGTWHGPRTVVMRFPTYADARAWYESDAYQRTMELRTASTITNLVIAAGVDA
jgi:uncharacterized protein (DUF1330 family)